MLFRKCYKAYIVTSSLIKEGKIVLKLKKIVFKAKLVHVHPVGIDI